MVNPVQMVWKLGNLAHFWPFVMFIMLMFMMKLIIMLEVEY